MANAPNLQALTPTLDPSAAPLQGFASMNSASVGSDCARGPNAAKNGTLQKCTHQEPIAHGATPITQNLASTVVINKDFAALQGSVAVCVPGVSNPLAKGDPVVYMEGRQAGRTFDLHAHAESVVLIGGASEDVFIGEKTPLVKLDAKEDHTKPGIPRFPSLAPFLLEVMVTHLKSGTSERQAETMREASLKGLLPTLCTDTPVASVTLPGGIEKNIPLNPPSPPPLPANAMAQAYSGGQYQPQTGTYDTFQLGANDAGPGAGNPGPPPQMLQGQAVANGTQLTGGLPGAGTPPDDTFNGQPVWKYLRGTITVGPRKLFVWHLWQGNDYYDNALTDNKNTTWRISHAPGGDTITLNDVSAGQRSLVGGASVVQVGQYFGDANGKPVAMVGRNGQPVPGLIGAPPGAPPLTSTLSGARSGRGPADAHKK